MLEDVSLAHAWVVRHARSLGGDPQAILLAGQSAGSHLVTLYLARQLLDRRHRLDGSSTPMTPITAAAEEDRLTAHPLLTPLPTAVLCLSGVYHMSSAIAPFRKRGMTDAMIADIFGDTSEASLDAASPSVVIGHLGRHRDTTSSSSTSSSDRLFGGDHSPLWVVAHGDRDAVALPSQSSEFYNGLVTAGLPATSVTYMGRGHTDPIIEDAMSPFDYSIEDLTDLCRWVEVQAARARSDPTAAAAGEPPSALAQPGRRGSVSVGSVVSAVPGATAFGAEIQPRAALNPDILIALGKAINPF